MSSELRSLWESAGGQVPQDWSLVPLEALLRDNKSIAVGVMYPGEHTPGGIPLIKVGDIKDGSIPIRPSYCISAETNQEYKRTQLTGDELLITLVGNPGECVVVKPEMVGWNPARAIAAIKLKDSELRTYLKAVLESSAGKHLIDSVLNTTVQKTLNLKDIRRLPIPMPDRAAIAAISQMSELFSNRITLLRETNATLEAIAQALFKSWFVDFDPVRAKMEGRTPEGMDEATAALFPDGFETSELGEVPRGWRAAKFEDFVQRLPVGKKFDQKTAKAEGLVPILDQGKSGVIGFHDEDPGVRASLDEPVVVFANHTCYMRLIAYDFSAIQNVLPFKGKGIDTVWAYYATKGRVNFSEYKGHWPDFTIEKAVVPSMCLGEAFRSVVDPLLRRVRLNEIQSNSLASLRDTLLPRLISGQLRLSDAEMEATAA